MAFSIATILMLLTLLINLSAVFLGRKLKKIEGDPMEPILKQKN